MKRVILLLKISLAVLLLQGKYYWEADSIDLRMPLCFMSCYGMIFVVFLFCSGNTHDDMLLAKFESAYTGSGGRGSSMVSGMLRRFVILLYLWITLRPFYDS